MSRGKALADRLARSVAHVLMGTRGWSDTAVLDFARSHPRLKVLEIGSGRQDLGTNAYSLLPAFPPGVEFVQSDVNPAFGHRVVDVTDMSIEAEFELILCMYVLEHVYDVQAAVANMHRALRPGGTMVIAVPHVYPYHDEPIDFWRFTEHSLRRLCADFASVEIRHKGMRRFPKALLVIASRDAA
jgi:SAM-dependent methyltransferase